VTLQPGGYVEILAKAFGGTPNAHRIEVSTVGRPDNTTELALAQVDEVVAHNSTHIFVMLGLKDTQPDPRTRVPSRHITQFVQDYRQLLRAVEQKSSSQVFLLTTHAVLPQRAGRQGWREILEQFNAEVRKLAKENQLHLIDIFEIFSRQGRQENLLEEDGTTLSPQGRELIAVSIAEYCGRISSQKT